MRKGSVTGHFNVDYPFNFFHIKIDCSTNVSKNPYQYLKFGRDFVFDVKI